MTTTQLTSNAETSDGFSALTSDHSGLADEKNENAEKIEVVEDKKMKNESTRGLFKGKNWRKTRKERKEQKEKKKKEKKEKKKGLKLFGRKKNGDVVQDDKPASNDGYMSQNISSVLVGSKVGNEESSLVSSHYSLVEETNKEAKVVEDLIEKGDTVFKKKDLLYALKLYDDACIRSRKAFSDDDVRIALVLGRIAKTWFLLSSESKDINEKRDCLLRAEQFYEDSSKRLFMKLGAGHEEATLVQNEKLIVKEQLKEFDIDGTVNKNVFDSKDDRVGDKAIMENNNPVTLVDRALLHSRLDEDEDAITLLEKAIPMIDTEQSYFPLVLLGDIYFKLGPEFYTKAFGCYEGALLVAKSYLTEAESSLSNISVFCKMGRICCEFGDLITGKRFFDKATSAYHQSPGRPLPEIKYACVLNNVGNVSYKLGEFQSAKENYLKAIAMKKRALGDGHISLIGPFTNLGMAYLKLSNAQQALHAFEDARQLLETKLNNVSSELALACINLGNAYRILNSFDAASICFDVVITNAARLGYSQEVLRALSLKGYMCFKKGNYVEALTYYKQCLENTKSSCVKSKLFHCIASVFVRESELTLALQYYQKALVIARSQKAYKSMGKTLQNMGNIYRKQKNYDEALKCFLEAQECRNFLQNTISDVDIVQLFVDTGKAYLAIKKYSDANDCFQSGKKLIQEVDSPQVKVFSGYLDKLMKMSTSSATSSQLKV